MRLAVPIGEDGFLDLTGFHRFHDFSQRAGADRRQVASDGTPIAGLPAAWQNIPGYPRVNPIIGDARSSLTTGFMNAGYDLDALSSAELRERWVRLTASPVPRISPKLLRLALAWEIQARRLGGHSGK